MNERDSYRNCSLSVFHNPQTRLTLMFVRILCNVSCGCIKKWMGVMRVQRVSQLWLTISWDVTPC